MKRIGSRAACFVFMDWTRPGSDLTLSHEDRPGFSISSLAASRSLVKKHTPCSARRSLPDQVINPFDEEFCITGTGANGVSLHNDENRPGMSLVAILPVHPPGSEPPTLPEV